MPEIRDATKKSDNPELHGVERVDITCRLNSNAFPCGPPNDNRTVPRSAGLLSSAWDDYLRARGRTRLRGPGAQRRPGPSRNERHEPDPPFRRRVRPDHCRGRDPNHRYLQGGPPSTAYTPRQPNRIPLQCRGRHLRQRQRQGRLAPRQLCPPDRQPQTPARRRQVGIIDRSHELFNAVVGGIGLLGIIMEATLQLRPVPSPFVEINRLPAPDVDALLEMMAQVEKSHDAAVVWVDAYARGRRIGRSVIHAARWIEHRDTESQRREILAAGYERLDKHRRFGLALHEKFGPILSLMLYAQRPMMDSFNRLYYIGCQLASLTGKSSTRTFSQIWFRGRLHCTAGPPRLRPSRIHGPAPLSAIQRREAIVELLGICRSSPCRRSQLSCARTKRTTV